MKTFCYDELFQKEEQLEKFVKLTDALGPENTFEYMWVLGDDTDDIYLRSVHFYYRKEATLLGWVGITYYLDDDYFTVSRVDSSVFFRTEDPLEAAQKVIALVNDL